MFLPRFSSFFYFLVTFFIIFILSLFLSLQSSYFKISFPCLSFLWSSSSCVSLFLSLSLANFDLPLYFSDPSLFLFPFDFPTPYRHHPLFPPLLPTTVERQSAERPQFEHASLRITKDLSVRRFHPRRRFLFSFLWAPLFFFFSLFLFFFSNFPSPVSCFFFTPSLSFLTLVSLSFGCSCASLFRATFAPCHRAPLDLLSKWIRRITDQTDGQYRRRSSCSPSDSYTIVHQHVVAGWPFDRSRSRGHVPVDKRLVYIY